MITLLTSRMAGAFVISLDHDLYVPGVEDPGDGLQISEHIAQYTPTCPVIIHTSNAARGKQMQGVLEGAGWEIRLAGAIGQSWIETDWITEVTAPYARMNS